MTTRIAAGLAVAAAVLAAAGPGERPAAAAPSVPSWSAPQVVWESQGHARYPVIVTDAYDRSHLFFIDQADDSAPFLLYHLDVSEDADGQATDVLVGVSAGYRVVADQSGLLHVLFHGPNNWLQYVSVDAREAADARSWPEPLVLGDATPGVALSAGPDGIVHACYPRSEGVYHRVSSDWGRTWSEEQWIQYAADGSIAATVACAAESGGGIHVAWTEVSPPNYYPSQGLFYSYSDDAGANWRPPVQVATEHFTLPRLDVDEAGVAHFLWQGDVAVGGRYYRRLDGASAGVWSPTELVVPSGRGGMSGDAPMAFDSAGNVHALTAADGIQYLMRVAGAWSSPLDLAATLADLPNQTGSIEEPALAVRSGNQLIAAWELDVRRIYLARASALAEPATPGPPEARDEPLATLIASASTARARVQRASSTAAHATPTQPVTYDRALGSASTTSSHPAAVGALAAAIVVAVSALVVIRRGRPAGRSGRW